MSEKVKLQELTEEEQIQKEFDALIEDYKHTNHKQKIELITKAFNFANVAWLSLTIILGALLGGLFGQYMLKKHFSKAGMVN